MNFEMERVSLIIQVANIIKKIPTKGKRKCRSIIQRKIEDVTQLLKKLEELINQEARKDKKTDYSLKLPRRNIKYQNFRKYILVKYKYQY